MSAYAASFAALSSAAAGGSSSVELCSLPATLRIGGATVSSIGSLKSASSLCAKHHSTAFSTPKLLTLMAARFAALIVNPMSVSASKISCFGSIGVPCADPALEFLVTTEAFSSIALSDVLPASEPPADPVSNPRLPMTFVVSIAACRTSVELPATSAVFGRMLSHSISPKPSRPAAEVSSFSSSPQFLVVGRDI